MSRTLASNDELSTKSLQHLAALVLVAKPKLGCRD